MRLHEGSHLALVLPSDTSFFPQLLAALLMGMGALGCVGPIFAGMYKEKRAQPVSFRVEVLLRSL